MSSTIRLFVCRVFRHYKQQDYARMFERVTPDTRERVIVYRALYGDQVTWCRPKTMFDEPGRFTALETETQVEVVTDTRVLHTETMHTYRLTSEMQLGCIKSYQ
jgi:hypothetical protein